MRIPAMGLDANGHSIWTDIDIPLVKRDNLRSLSADQAAVYWGLAVSQISPPGDKTMALTNQPRIVWVMAGHAEIMMENGDIRRFGTGDALFVHGKARHHSSHMGREPSITLNVTFPGTDGFVFK